jgi:allene oxide cyclase
MKRLLKIALPVAATAALLVAVMAWASPGHGKAQHVKTIALVEHATTDATTDTGEKGDSVGDVLTFSNELRDASDTKTVGQDQGYCIRTLVGQSYECNWTNLFGGGQITVEGPFYDTSDSTLTITGGTRKFRGAKGSMTLKSLEGGTKYSFVFHITR